MCPPRHFAVAYAINPWMRLDEPVDPGRAQQQWQGLVDRLRGFGHEVTVMPAVEGLPDLVFTANGGIVIGERALLPRFRYPQRQGETPCFEAALRALGLRTALPRADNEGEGDFLFTGDRILAGIGPRSAAAAAEEVGEYFGLPVRSLQLVDPRFYHLDTALAVLDEHTLAYWPGAFDATAQDDLRRWYPEAIIAGEADAEGFGLNLVSDGQHVVLSAAAPRLAGQLSERGFDVHPVDVSELRKAGGGAKCCVLTLHQPPVSRAEP